MRSEGYSTWSESLLLNITFHMFIRATNNTNLLGGYPTTEAPYAGI